MDNYEKTLDSALTELDFVTWNDSEAEAQKEVLYIIKGLYRDMLNYIEKLEAELEKEIKKDGVCLNCGNETKNNAKVCMNCELGGLPYTYYD